LSIAEAYQKKGSEFRRRESPCQRTTFRQGVLFLFNRERTLGDHLPQVLEARDVKNTAYTGHTSGTPHEDGIAITPRTSALLGCAVGGSILETHHRIRLWAFLTLDDIKLDIIALFQRLVPVQLDCGVMHEDIRPVIATDESVALGVVKPLDLPFVLSHRLLLSLGLAGIRRTRGRTPIQLKTREIAERLIEN
jgi:hypothetical protein